MLQMWIVNEGENHIIISFNLKHQQYYADKISFHRAYWQRSLFTRIVLTSISELRQHRFTKEKHLFDYTRIKSGREICVFEQGFDNMVCR